MTDGVLRKMESLKKTAFVVNPLQEPELQLQSFYNPFIQIQTS